MASRKISQRLARQTRKQLNELQEKYCSFAWSSVPGTKIRELTLSESSKAALGTVRKLNFYLAARLEDDVLRLYAVKP